MALDFSLLQMGGNPGNALLQGFQQGQAMRRQEDSRNALAKLLQNPGDEQAFGVYSQIDPEGAFKYQQHRDERADKLADRNIRLSEAQRKAMEQRVETIANLAMYADSPEKWDQGIDQLVQMGYSDLAAYKGKFSPENRQAAIAGAGKTLEWLKAQAPNYISGGEGSIYQLPSDIGGAGAPQPAAGPAMDLEAMARDAIAKGADPAAVRARMQQMQGGAGPQAPRPFP